jgi:hypothetical protein
MIDLYKKFMMYYIDGLLKYQLMRNGVSYLLLISLACNCFQLIRGILLKSASLLDCNVLRQKCLKGVNACCGALCKLHLRDSVV